jgi:hypothetical protein
LLATDVTESESVHDGLSDSDVRIIRVNGPVGDPAAAIISTISTDEMIKWIQVWSIHTLHT